MYGINEHVINGVRTDAWGRPIQTAAQRNKIEVDEYNQNGAYTTIQGGMQHGQKVPVGNWQPRRYADEPSNTNTLGNFVSQMSGGGGGAAPAAAPAAAGPDFAGQISTAQGAINAQLAQPQPTLETGNRYGSGLTASEGRLNRLMDNASELQASPAYNFRVKQGQQALERSLGAKGLLNSGNRLTALTNYGQEAGSQEYENEFTRRKGVFDAYANNYNTDRQGNITQFNAQSNAANNRLGTLSDLMSKGNSAYNQANQTAATERIGWGNIWEKQNQKQASPWNQQTGSRLT